MCTVRNVMLMARACGTGRGGSGNSSRCQRLLSRAAGVATADAGCKGPSGRAGGNISSDIVLQFPSLPRSLPILLQDGPLVRWLCAMLRGTRCQCTPRAMLTPVDKSPAARAELLDRQGRVLLVHDTASLPRSMSLCSSCVHHRPGRRSNWRLPIARQSVPAVSGLCGAVAGRMVAQRRCGNPGGLPPWSADPLPLQLFPTNKQEEYTAAIEA
jgi:hypothetical protein